MISANRVESTVEPKTVENIQENGEEKSLVDVHHDDHSNQETTLSNSSSWNFILLSLLFITIELIIYLFENKISSHLLVATNCPASSIQSPEFSSIACLSPRRVIYGWSSIHAQPQIIISILLYPILFPNWIALFIGLVILYVVRGGDNLVKPSIFHHLFQIYQIQYSAFIIRAVISFVMFRVFGWTESLLWAFDAFHFVSCNGGGTSIVIYHLVRFVSDDKKNGSILKMGLLVIIAFAFHFTSHFPLSYIPLVSPSLVNSPPSNYLIDHISACILTIVFSD